MRQLIAIILTSILLACGGCAVFTDGGTSGAAATDLRCEYLVDPLGIDVPKPRLSWVVRSKQRGQMQTAYQILVASSEENLAKNQGDLWDTGKVESDQSIHVAYEGKRLRSRMRCFWKVRVWDAGGKPGRYSRRARWEMGFLWAWDWQARWLSAPPPPDESVQPSPLFRKTFVLEKPIKKARAYVCGLGYYELYLNGKKVGDNVLDPAFTHYDRRVLYVTYDVTNYVRPRSNAVGVMLGNGWYNMHTRAVWGFDQAPWRDRPTMLCQLEVEFTDGSSQVIASDSTWKVSTGPILFDSIRSGERYDARLEKHGW
ncbi:MAG: alpha-L-rhamnosidase N-terminal domain-containing protein, partial [Sedimentisphaerales bacterium]